MVISYQFLLMANFSFSDRMGLRKHLSTAEIVEQAVVARRLFTSEFGSITNVVFMVSLESSEYKLTDNNNINDFFCVFV